MPAPDPTPLRRRPAWSELEAHYERMKATHLRDLFESDPGRGERLTLDAEGIYLDYSKNRVDDAVLEALLALAGESDLRARIDAMFSGEKINITEDRAVLHVALRAPKSEHILVDGSDGWPSSPTRSAVATGAATPAGPSAPW
jgi:glucose-6-phosphate isomerase